MSCDRLRDATYLIGDNARPARPGATAGSRRPSPLSDGLNSNLVLAWPQIWACELPPAAVMALGGLVEAGTTVHAG